MPRPPSPASPFANPTVIVSASSFFETAAPDCASCAATWPEASRRCSMPAAGALLQLGEQDEARRLATEELELARTWGAPRALGAALRAAGLIEGGERGLALLEEAVQVLSNSPAKLEHAKARTELGAALRRANQRSQAREQLRHALELATI